MLCPKATAAAAALAFAACQSSSHSPSPSDEALPTRAEALSPVAHFTPVPAPPEPQVDQTPSAVDAGDVDLLSLAHETPDVDHLRRAKALSSDGDLNGALTEARRALYSTPGDEETLTLVARLARKSQQWALSALAYGQLAQIQPDDATALIQKARAHLALKEPETALSTIAQAIERDREHAEVWQVNGLAQLAVGDLKSAIASFGKVVEIAPTHGWALNNLGFALLRANENERALEILDRAAEALPTVAAVQNNLGVALERTGRAEEARSAYLRAMDLSPKYIKARINLGRVARAPMPQPGNAESLDDLVDVPHPLPEQPTSEDAH